MANPPSQPRLKRLAPTPINLVQAMVVHSSNDDFETLADPSDHKRGPGRPGTSLKARAIGYLSRREHSRQELQRKLAPHAQDADQLEQLLDDLQRENWLSNERFAQSLVHRRAARQGANLVMQELRRHGLPENTISQLGQQLHDTEADRAQAVWQKKFGKLPVDPKEYARQFRFLASRGFGSECVRRILGSVPYGAD